MSIQKFGSIRIVKTAVTKAEGRFLVHIMKELRLGVIGRTAFGSGLCDGQTVKTQVLVEELKIKYPCSKIDIADTYDLIQRKRVRLLMNVVKCMIKDDVIFVLLSANGRRVLFPIIAIMNKILKKIIIHDCIGGKIGQDASANPNLVKNMNSFSTNYVESNSLVAELKEAGVTNAEYLPNFKRLSILDESELKSDCKDIRVCTFSRVCKAKGITNAAMAVSEINKKHGKTVVYLDVYGPVEKEYKAEFEKLLEASNGEVVYKGVANPSESVGILKNYYSLLFPTVFEGEGFPGTLIDAFSSGVPIIATNWHLNSEIIQDGYTGLLYDPEKPEKLKELMEKLMDDPALVFEMRKHCLAEARKYSPEIVMDTIGKKIMSLSR